MLVLPLDIKIIDPRLGTEFPLPRYETEGAAAIDLRAMIAKGSHVIIPVGGRVRFGVGFALSIPRGYVGKVYPRSGLATKHGIDMCSSGVIDSDFRGEIAFTAINHGQEPFRVNAGDRIAQMVFMTYLQAQLRQVEELDETKRGTGGLGSTGVAA